jgi:hypothetical protein
MARRLLAAACAAEHRGVAGQHRLVHRDRIKALAREVDDLTAKVPTGTDGQTYLRAILLVADHTAYHVGQLVALRRALGIWR